MQSNQKKRENKLNAWYIKTDIPDSVKLKLAREVKGKVVDKVTFSSIRKDLLLVNASLFQEVFMINRHFLYNGEYTAPPGENDYVNAKNYLTEDGLAGFSISQSGWLTSLFSNYSQRGFAAAAKNIIVQDAYKLVCVVSASDTESHLVNFYCNQYGFSEYARTINDTEVMRKYYGDSFIQPFIEQKGIPFHVFMIGHNALGEGKEVKKFAYYFDAEKYVNETVVKRGY